MSTRPRVLLHEIGHCLAARSIGGEAVEIVLSPIGGLAQTTGSEQSPWKWIWVAFAGPLMHVLIGAGCVAVMVHGGYLPVIQDFNPLGELSDLDRLGGPTLLAYLVFKIQLALFCLNVFLPAYPLDGGRILVGLLSFEFPLQRTVKIIGVTSLLSAIVLQVDGTTWLAVWLGVEGVQLLLLNRWNLEGHPIARLYDWRARPVQLVAASSVVPGLELVPCPQCGERLHPRSEQCVGCGARFPAGPASATPSQP